MTNAHIKRTGLDKFGVPIESNDNSFQGPEEAVANRLNSSHVQRAQTSNKGFRRYTNFFKQSKTNQPSIEIQSNYGNGVKNNGYASERKYSTATDTKSVITNQSKQSRHQRGLASLEPQLRKHQDQGEKNIFVNDNQVPNNMNVQ